MRRGSVLFASERHSEPDGILSPSRLLYVRWAFVLHDDPTLLDGYRETTLAIPNVNYGSTVSFRRTFQSRRFLCVCSMVLNLLQSSPQHQTLPAKNQDF